MIEIKNSSLKKKYYRIKTVVHNLENLSKQQIRNHRSNIFIIQSENASNNYIQRDYQKYFDKLFKNLNDMFFLDIIATFEFEAFTIFQANRSNIIKTLLKSNFNSLIPYIVEINKHIKNLQGIKYLLKHNLSCISADEINKLENIINHRDWLAHGKRVLNTNRKKSENQEKIFKIEETILFLDNILVKLENIS